MISLEKAIAKVDSAARTMRLHVELLQKRRGSSEYDQCWEALASDLDDVTELLQAMKEDKNA